MLDNNNMIVNPRLGTHIVRECFPALISILTTDSDNAGRVSICIYYKTTHKISNLFDNDHKWGDEIKLNDLCVGQPIYMYKI